MRDCPICGSNGKRVVMNDYGGEGVRLGLFACADCGHRYLDADVSQAWFDEYYAHRYITDVSMFGAARWETLAEYIASYEPIEVLDIGGLDGELAERIRAHGIYCRVAGVQTEVMGKFDAVVLSHTLEHVYDLPGMMAYIKDKLKAKGLLFVEGPVHLAYVDPMAYDPYWQHINKFRPEDMDALFKRYGLDILESERLDDYQEYHCWRTVGQYANSG